MGGFVGNFASRLAAFVAFGAALAACGGGGGGAGPGPGNTAGPTNPPAPNVVPSGAIYLGAFVNTSGVNPPPASDITTLETEIGRTLALSLHYHGFYDVFPGAVEAADAAAGRIPIESWNCQYPNSAIAAGNQDTAIRQRADALKAFGKPIFLRYMWEMNAPSSANYRSTCWSATTDDPNGIFSPTQFIAAWDHIRAIFAQEGASNVIWVWCPTAQTDPSAYYPGASEVDWVGFDKYDGTNATFAATFQTAYGYFSNLGKPLLIDETGANAANQPAFFAAAPTTLQTQYPLIKGLVYFDASGDTGAWVLTTAGLSAFATMGADPYFSAMGP
jgi:hypothetical protein